MVCCEGVPALFIISAAELTINHDQIAANIEVLTLGGNPLALAVFDHSIVVSTDSLHKPGSTTDIRKELSLVSAL